MVPVIARKEVTLSSGKADVNLGFVPDYVDIQAGPYSSASSGDIVTMKGKPSAGSSSAKIVGVAHSGSSSAAQIAAISGNEVKQMSNSYHGLSLDFSSTAGIASSGDLTVMAFRHNG